MIDDDLSILEIAADIIDETGRSMIANQVRTLKDRIANWFRQAEERERAWRDGEPKIIISESPLHRNSNFWHTLQAIQNAQHEHRLHSASAITELIQE